MLVEPDGTTGSYVLLDKVTRTPFATVNQAGTQTTVSGQGVVSFNSSVQLSQEAQDIINKVFALKFTDNSNPQSNTKFTDVGIPQNTFIQTLNGQFVPVTFLTVSNGLTRAASGAAKHRQSGRSHPRSAHGQYLSGSLCRTDCFQGKPADR